MVESKLKSIKITPTFFGFTSYKFEPAKKRIIFNYKIEFKDKEPLQFSETILLPEVPKIDKIPEGLINNLLQAVHLILGISYFKLYCPPKIKLNYSISKEQADFWNSVYKNGLGEFLYRNKIDPKTLAEFPFSKDCMTNSYSLKPSGRSLVGVGGGKDSIVAVELLKENGQNITAFAVETQKPTAITNNVIKEMGIKPLIIRRMLDEKIFLKYEDSYNGHIPVSAVFAFLGLLSSVFYQYDNVIMANEYSSNFGNLEYDGVIINHQWSKSAEFENLLQRYVRNFITPSNVYFSLLRPYYEIRIVKMFVKYKKYFPYFSSCNASFKVNEPRLGHLWCGNCPKCAFIFLLFSAFLPRRELIKIFAKNLFEDEMLLSLFKDILGFGDLKPFDCVGTFEEAQAALYLARKKFKRDLVVKAFLPRIENPKVLIKKVFSSNKAATVPADFRFIGVKNILILGYGREGVVTRRFLKKKFPHLRVGIADKKYGPKYLEKQEKYDLAVKTPGLPENLVQIPYTTATNLFFSEIKKRGNTIIGVSGSKGKSTTTSLIYSILKEAELDVQILGNIGIPMLGALMKPIPKDRIYVLELSSYQLSDIWFSPNIAVITNLFPEHMDYHGGEENYYDAKRRIIEFQSNDDVFVFNHNNDRSILWAKLARSKTISFAKQIPLVDADIPLLGSHNKENIKAAVAVAKIFNITDSKISEAIKNFEPLHHRLQLVGEFKGVKFYDDAISTTPESTIAALKSVPDVATIFLGGTDRGYDFSELEKVLRHHTVKNIVLFPDSGKRILKSKQGFNILETDSMEEAVKFAYKNTPAGSTCLLSCASPSYSLWKDFEAKGDEFEKQVKKYGK